ncbi:putative WD repeat-containing protein [Wickerhamomyces ciferrii]|uniref:WD repeat-containing protein n=1 Tax=Wickerhamomyces ciferrii (strain ATCC 14091 / BCRC 22168 / CBS 111 / JCM 3599 / NBRC 0793 / NRRL Y-1031 F-60-10) TaxID=1206466 RepID=K0KG34_WICCF|nr:putative WD repeat-containing protein [Wickerhamomyces ciferrii]CCH41901.1 putative WD repeat-containing protein [Wickerhamomyces ciferrii]
MDSLPIGFGEGNTAGAQNHDIYSRYLRPVQPKESDESESDNSDSDDSDSDDDKEQFPITHSFQLDPHTRRIESTTFSPHGDKLYSSSNDLNLNIYDFNQMNPISSNPVKSLEIYETKFIKILKTNSRGDLLAIPNSGFSFRALDSKGSTIHEFPEGDRYIYDVTKTKGHTDIITDCSWSPTNPDKFITCSNDSTFRIWNLKTKQQESVVFIKDKGKKTKVKFIRYTIDSKYIIVIDNDSRLTIWDLATNLKRPMKEIQLNSKIMAIETSTTDENSIVVRSSDYSLKLYDLRTDLSRPVIQRLNFKTMDTPYTNQLIYHDQFIITFINNEQDLGKNELHILDKSDLVTLEKLSYDEEITSISWKEEINQIIVGFKSGKLEILFNPQVSKNGIKISINNKPKKRKNFDENDNFITSSTSNIAYNMNELAELNKSKKSKTNDNDEPKKQKFIWGTTDAEKIENNINLEDPREALKKFVESKK